jgi:holo-[acyl-carrier protein] synthase
MIIGIGTDMIEVLRLEKNIGKPQFLSKVFTERELEICMSKQSRLQSLAARFAAKEAFMKALGTGWSGGISFSQIEVINDEKGAPRMILHGKSRSFADRLGVTDIHVTLSHLKEIALATVILEK